MEKQDNFFILVLTKLKGHGRYQSLLLSTRMGSHPLLMVDVKVYYSQREYIFTFAESMCIYKFNECIPENVLII